MLTLAFVIPRPKNQVTELAWYTNLNEAYAVSKKENKPIFAFFTGSDWCGWCKKLQRDVFAKDSFKKWANEKVVLLELDFPRSKTQPDDLKQQNQSLQQAFQIRGYPTVWLFYTTKDETTNNFSIEALGSLGYPTGAEPGKEDAQFINTANTILANKKK